MKKNNKKLFIIIGLIAVVLVLGIFVFVKSNNNSKELTLTEKNGLKIIKKV